MNVRWTNGLAPRVVRCPACGGKSLYAPENPHRPFCSARCRHHDLGAWATESYRIERKPSDDDLEGAPDDSA
jgi:endogenous inhibitor of DNA gyrase (YacG/DUF329 family)